MPADRPDLSVAWSDAQLGYGYQTWIFNSERRMFALWRGIVGALGGPRN